MNYKEHPTYRVAEKVFEIYVEKEMQRERHWLKEVLIALGYAVWTDPTDGHAFEDSKSAWEKLFHRNKKYWNNFESPDTCIEGLGDALANMRNKTWGEPKGVPVRMEYLKGILKVSPKGVLSWGLDPSLGRGVVFHSNYDYLELSLIDNKKVVYSETDRPDGVLGESDIFLNLLNLDKIEGLRSLEDGFRVELKWKNENWGTGGMPWKDFAKNEKGEWVEVEYQGRDWDGVLDTTPKSEEEQNFEDLKKEVLSWANEIQHGMAHVRKWTKVLRYLEGELPPKAFTAEEIEKQWRDHKKNKRWSKIVEVRDYVEAKYKRAEYTPAPKKEEEPKKPNYTDSLTLVAKRVESIEKRLERLEK